MPFTSYTRTVVASLVALSSLAAYGQTGVNKTQTVILVVNGENFVLKTTAATVGELLQEQHQLLSEQRALLGEQLQPSAPLTAILTEGMQVAILPKTAPATAAAPKKPSAPMKVVVAKKEAARGALSSRGVLGNLSRYEGKRVLSLTATGYGPGENGQWGDRTRMGTRVRYGVVAVDPRVIKLGTRLYVEGYGECVAEDTGGAIKGMRIDLAFNSDRVANQYGRKRVRVVILD
jgi:3D (Asp-Asp-Asp) domain-containing protein